ncbi:MAG TPA: hypothetical protein VES67_21650 [Vicinamibacterales bacterium]|nr:hypothetical protein [Vicinamibacterales bacterium]
MNVFLRVINACLGGCRHRHTYRERRSLHGTEVMHLVCEDCGYAVPAVNRTAEEHRHVVEEGAIKPATVRRHAADVLVMDDRSRARTEERRRTAS